MNNPTPVTQAVILAGGYGTRLRPFTNDSPKPMYPFEDKPFLEYLICQVRDFGIKEIVILLGYLPEKITDYFGDGSQWGVNITYSTTPVDYETGLRLKGAEKEGKLANEFLLMYCDNYCPVDFQQLVQDYHNSGALLQFTAYRNLDGYTKSNLKITEDGRVDVYDKKRTTPGLQGVDIGYAIVDRQVLDLIPEENCNFEQIVYPSLVKQKKLYATVTEHRYYSIGSWERIKLTKEFFSPRKFIFLDRDGTLNQRFAKAHYVERPDEFTWLPGAREALVRLCQAGYQLVLITNQPGVARGNFTKTELAAIHEKMNSDLAKVGAKVHHIYYCPHNWDEGCACRKPAPGMLLQAQKDLSLDLTKCWMLGDDERDMHAGASAGCKCMMVSSQHPLSEAVDYILRLERSDR